LWQFFEPLGVQRRRGKQCRDKKARQAIVFAHVFPAKITVLGIASHLRGLSLALKK
jgi:hypothetical protein